FSEETLLVPWQSLHHVLFQANNPELAAEFDAIVAQKPKQDVLRLQSRDGKSVNTFKGVLGETDGRGKTLLFQADGGNPSNIVWERVRGLYFARPAADNAAPICKVIDNGSNVFVATTVATERRQPIFWGKEEAWVRFQTPAGLEARL